MQLACTILLSVTCPALQYLSTLPHKRHDFFWGGVTELETCVLIFSATFVSFYDELSEIRSNVYIGIRVKYPLFLSYFNET